MGAFIFAIRATDNTGLAIICTRWTNWATSACVGRKWRSESQHWEPRAARGELRTL